MRSVKRYLRRQLAELRLAPRRRALTQDVSRALGSTVRLVRTGARGHDSVYYAVSRSARLGVLRVVNPYLRRGNPGSGMPFVSLEPRLRLEHEWNAYTKLSPKGLSPRPLWQGRDAILCAYLSAPRFSQLLEKDPGRVWDLAAAAAKSLHAMHQAGVVHMDTCFANVLGDGQPQASWIDFEYGPSPGISFDTACAYDYLRLVESSLKFLTPPQRTAPEQWLGALAPFVEDGVRAADLAPLRPAVGRLLADGPLVVSLAGIFPSLGG